MTRKISTVIGRVAAGLAALSMVAATSAASAQGRYYRDHHRGNGNKTETAIVAGVLGLAVGAAIAGNHNNDRYDSRYDRRGYYAPPPPPPRYGYGYGYGYAPRHHDRYRSECWVTRDYDRRSGTVYERTVCR
jgi:hypothetical protein